MGMRTEQEIRGHLEELRSMTSTAQGIGCGAGRLMLAAVVHTLLWALGDSQDTARLLQQIPSRDGDATCLEPQWFKKFFPQG